MCWIDRDSLQFAPLGFCQHFIEGPLGSNAADSRLAAPLDGRHGIARGLALAEGKDGRLVGGAGKGLQLDHVFHVQDFQVGAARAQFEPPEALARAFGLEHFLGDDEAHDAAILQITVGANIGK